MKRSTITFCLFCIAPFVAYGQTMLPFQQINVNEGLSQSSVNYVFQGKDGFMWFATGDGIDRYDGKRCVAYKSRFNADGTGLFGDRNINCHVLEDNHKKLWVASDAGVSYMNRATGRFKIVLDRYATRSAVIPIDAEGDSVWMCGANRGVFLINSLTLHSVIYPFTDAWQTGATYINIISAANTARVIWILDKKGLLIFDKRTHKERRVIASDSLTGMCLLHDGRILFGTPNGVMVYNILYGPYIDLRASAFVALRSDQRSGWRNFAEDSTGTMVYMASLKGGRLCGLDMRSFQTHFIDFPQVQITSLFIDHSRNLWVGTDGEGVFRKDLKPARFNSYSPELSENGPGLMVKSVYRDDDGMMWIGTFNAGLMLYNPVDGRAKTTTIFPATGSMISTILKDSLGNIVVADRQVLRWLKNSGKGLQCIGAVSLPANGPQLLVDGMAEWKPGHYIVGTNQGVISVVFNGQAATVRRARCFTHDSLLCRWVYGVYKAPDGTIYLGQRQGYAHLRVTDDTSITVLEHGLNDISIRHFYQVADKSAVWMATEHGLLLHPINTGKYQVIDESSGLANGFIYAIVPENDTSLWVSTNRGLAHINVRYRQYGDAHVHITNYSLKDGLQSNEFNTGASFRCGDGTIIFGGINGINWFHPAQIRSNPFPAQPAIAEIRVNDSLYAGDTACFVKDIFLPYTKNTISFILDALEFSNAAENRYAYKLEGLDKDWVYSENDKVRYANIPPGKYRFLLKASNNDGVWGSPLLVNIIIAPPFWQTWWFRSLVAAVAAMLVLAIARLYARQKIIAKTRELEKIHTLNAERLRISKDVHDDLGAGLSEITLMAEVAGQTSKDNAHLQRISSVSRELINNMRELIWVLNPENSTLDQLVTHLREYLGDLSETLPVKLCTHLPNEVPAIKINSVLQRNIFLSVKEAVNNAVKHAMASQITVTMTAGVPLTVVVADNGRGFDAAGRTNGNGLNNMKHRIEVIGGTFELGRINGTTEVRISVDIQNVGINVK